ncbi:MAG TPA: LysR family transcriptional regulator [Dehalococcoidia bacterium]|jgi:DNA-binding transcriptional LysR family regulator|nr:LysR family transcriptional regulator [Dehalococcoidia bacterium]
MQIPQLVSFYHVARLRSVTQAAKTLRLGQPAVTNHLKKLEKELGVVLFDRVHRPIQLTSEGSTILEMIAPVVNGLDALKTYLNHSREGGSLTIAAFSELVMYPLPKLVQNFRVKYPDVLVRLVSRTHAEMLQLIKSGEADIALSGAPSIADPSLEFTELFRTRTVLVAPLGHELLNRAPVQFSDIGQFPLLLYNPGTIIRSRLQRNMEDLGINYNVALELENAEIVKRYVQVGMGVSIVGDMVLEPEDYQKMGVIEIDHLLPDVTIGLHTLKGRFQSQPALNFIQALKTDLMGPKV